MSADLPHIGFIGLGIMGLPMARHLSAAGYTVKVYNRTPARVKEAAAFAQVVRTPREAADGSRYLITMVTNPEAVQAVVEGSEGALAATSAGTWIQMSTLDIESTLRFSQLAQKRGWSFLDCPVTGSKKQVESAQLILLAGGEAKVIQETTPLLQKLGKTIVHAGPVGAGTALKLCMNLIVAQMTTALVEATRLAEATGVDPAKIFDVLRNSPALDCGYYRIKEEALIRKDFRPAFSLANMLKDVHFMLTEAKKRGVTLSVTQAVAELMQDAVREGHAQEDLAAIYLTRPSLN